MKKVMVTGTILALALMAAAVHAQPSTYREHIEELIESRIKSWLQDPAVVESVKAQNTQHADLQQDDILVLDNQWRAERQATDQPLIDKVLAKPLSTFLKEIKANNEGLFSEIFVMDNKGLNVGQSDVTSDYWQGDEVKWQQTYLAGPDGLVMGDREFDRSSGKFLIQISLSVVDPDSQEAIGAVTVGVNLVKLMRAHSVASSLE